MFGWADLRLLRSPTTVIFVAAMLLFPLPLIAGQGRSQHSLSGHLDASGVALVAGIQKERLSNGQLTDASGPGLPRVSKTVDLLNGSVFGGNVQPANGLNPSSVTVVAGDAFITASGSNNLLVLNLSRDSIVAAVPVGEQPVASSFDPGSGALYVVNDVSSNVTVIDPATDGVLRNYNISGYIPAGVAVDPPSSRLYIADSGDDALDVRNASTGGSIASIGLAGSPEAVVFDARNNRVLAAILTSSYQVEVAFVDAATDAVLGYSHVGSDTYGDSLSLAVDESLNTVFATNPGPGEGLTALNASSETEIGNLSFGNTPGGICADPARNLAYETDRATSNVTVVNASALSVVATVRAGAEAIGIGVDPGSGTVVLANQGADNLTIIEGPIPHDAAWVATGVSPGGIAEDPGSGFVAVLIPERSELLGIKSDTLQLAAKLATPPDPQQVVWNAPSGRFFAVELGGNVTSMYGTNGTVAQSAAAPAFTSSLAVDNSYGQLYAVGSESYTGSYGPVISVFGLSSLSYLTQYSLPSRPGTIGVDTSTYSLWVPLPDDVSVAQINITNGHVDQTVGLGSDAQAAVVDSVHHRVYVSIGGSNSLAVINASSGSIITRLEVGTTPEGLALDTGNDTLYVANSGSANVSVIDTATNTVEGAIPVGDGPTAITTDDPAGAVYVTNSQSGTVSVLTRPPEATYAVSFIETGLSGQNWSATFNGVTESTTGTSLNFSLGNGTYAFTISPPLGFSASPLTGSITITGASSSKAISFAPITPPTFRVGFEELGLPGGTSWSISFNGSAESSATPWINVTASNGSYGYSISAIGGFSANRTSGTVDVVGGNTTVLIGFAANSSSPSGIPLLWIGAGLAVIVVVAVAAVVVLARRRGKAPRSASETPS
jgi:YVTN family beta-propeller protein